MSQNSMKSRIETTQEWNELRKNKNESQTIRRKRNSKLTNRDLVKGRDY